MTPSVPALPRNPLGHPILFPPQQQLLDLGFCDSRESWLICAPTGSGKTLMAEWALAGAVSAGFRGAYVAPLRAILEERHADWVRKFSETRLGVFTGESSRTGGKVRPTDEMLLLFTPEKLASFTQNWKGNISWLSELDVLVVDEFHLLGDPNRGAGLEGLLNRIRRINPFLRIVGLSATLSNAAELAGWMNARLFQSVWRPIQLDKSVRYFKRATDKPEMLLEEVRKTLAEQGKVLAFVNSRRRAESLAKWLQEAGLAAYFSHAGRTHEERARVHDAMRSGEADVLVATSTVEMGVNFPARKVVIYDSYSFEGESFARLSIQRYLQFSGRAGRPGLDPKGESILFAPVWDGEAVKYPDATPEPVRSGLFRTDALLRELLFDISTRLSISERHLEINSAERSLWRSQGGLRDVAPYVQHLVTAGLVRRVNKGNRVFLTHTPLGRIATQMAVSPNTVGLYTALGTLTQPLNDFDILLIGCLPSEATPKIGFRFEDIDEMGDVVLTVESHLLDQRPDVVQRLMRALTVRSLLSALKAAVILHRHSLLEPLDSLATLFDTYETDLRTLRSNVGWTLAVAQRCFSVMAQPSNCAKMPNEDKAIRLYAALAEKCQTVRLMVEYGIPRTSLGLVRIAGVGPRRAQRLCREGISTLAALVALDSAELLRILNTGQKTADAILKAAQSNPLATNPSQESRPANAVPWHLQTRPVRPDGVDPYRLRRSLELTVDHLSPEVVRLSGGAEPHQVRIVESPGRVRSYECDCADFAKGHHQCKHVLRARLELRDDKELRILLDQLKSTGKHPLRESLGQLWMQVGREYDAFNGGSNTTSPTPSNVRTESLIAPER